MEMRVMADGSGKAEGKAKDRLLQAAGRLFAEHGFDAVSVRDITGEAGMNVAALNYHFGSRKALIQSVAAGQLGPLHKERMARLEAVERKWSGKTPPLELVLEAMARPLVMPSGAPERCRLLARLLGAEGIRHHPAAVRNDGEKVRQRFLRLLGRSLPDLPAIELEHRAGFATGGMVWMLMRIGDGADDAAAGGVNEVLGSCLRFAAAGIAGGPEGSARVDGKAGAGQAMFDF